MIDYSSYAAEVFKNIISNGDQLADIESAHQLAERLKNELEALLSRLESCIQRVQAKISEYQSRMANAQTIARQARSAASAAAQELSSTPRTKKAVVREGQPPVEVPANQEKISALNAKIASEQQKAAQYEQEAARYQEKINILNGDLQALSSERSKLNEYIRAAEELRSAMREAYGKADSQCKDYVLRDIERAEKLMAQYDSVRFLSPNYCDVNPIREKE